MEQLERTTRTVLVASALPRSGSDFGARARTLVSSHGGASLAEADDRVRAAFSSAGRALQAAVALHDDLGARGGLAAGDVTERNGLVAGPSVEIAMRLHDAAAPGEILLESVVALMADASVDVRLVGAGRLLHEGRSIELLKLPPSTGGVNRWPFPSTLEVAGGRPFVGRERELAQLDAVWAGAVNGGSGIALIGGEAGAGKTRLVAEFAARRHAEGAIVVAGLCDHHLALPYQPWAMIVEQMAAALPDDALDEHGEDLNELSLLVPTLAGHDVVDEDRRTGDPDSRRHRLFRAVRSLLRAAGRIAPLVVVVDDLHWAGRQTLEMVHFLARAAPVEGATLVATFRDTGDEVTEPLATTLADLRRVDHVRRLKLSGLDPGAVRSLLEAAGLTEADDVADVAARLTERTGGNPFFLWEVHGTLSGASTSVPDGVREVVAARLASLSSPARRIAEVIALASGPLEVAVAGRAAGLDTPALIEPLDELLRSGLVEELAGTDGFVRYRHALLQETVVDLMPAVRRAHDHLAVGEALEQAHAQDRRRVLPALTQHFAAAASVGGSDKAAYYGRRAAAQARQTAAYDEAVGLLRVALDVLPEDGVVRAELLVDLLDLLQRSGDLTEAVRTAEVAFAAATRSGDQRLRAEAAIALERSSHLAHDALARRRSAELLRAVLADVPVDDDTLRARVRAAHGRAAAMVGDPAAPELVREALAEARRTGDDDAISLALETATTVGSPEEVLDATAELRRITRRTGHVWRSMWASGNEARALIELARLSDARTVLAQHAILSSEFGFVLFRFLNGVMASVLALAEGDAERAEAEINEVERLSEREDSLPGRGVHGLQMFMIRREQDRLGEMRPFLELLRRSTPDRGVWGPGLTMAFAELGMLDDARSWFERLAADDAGGVERDALWPVSVAFLAETCFLLDDRRHAPHLLAELEPYGGAALCAAFGASAGLTDRLRGALHEVCGRPDEADRLLAAADDLATREGAPGWRAQVARTQALVSARRGDGTRRAPRPPLAGAGSSRGIRTPGGLSPRELEVITLVAAGRSNREIAAELYISPNTAANHVRSILQKTGCANRTEAAAYAHRRGLAEP